MILDTLEQPSSREYNDSMGRLSRLVIPGVPHHVTQRGVRRMRIFESDDDRSSYLRKLEQKACEHFLEIRCWCLMPNHVHLVVIPTLQDSMSAGIGLAHWAYTRYYNDRHAAKGRLFQGRFFSTPMDEPHYYAAVRYVLANPVRAGMTVHAWDYKWSSVRYHMHIVGNDPLVRDPDVLGEGYQWREMLSRQLEELNTIRKRTFDGYPCGSESFVEDISRRVGISLSRKPVGRPPKKREEPDEYCDNEDYYDLLE